MYFSPMSQDRATAADRRAMDLTQNMLLMSVPSVGAIAGSNPVAGIIFLEEVERLIDWKKAKNTILAFFGRNAELRDQMEATLGVELPVDDKELPVILTEVHRFKWLEAERYGRDIWRERSPRDPDGGALREWFRLHFGAWYLHHRKLRQAMA